VTGAGRPRPQRSPARRLLVATILLATCHGQLRFDDAACVQEGDCPLPTLHCMGGSCVGCVSDQHCTTPGFPRCDSALHRCVPCGVNSDCASGQACRTGHCLTTCTTATSCPASAPRCDDGFCVQCDDGKGCLSTAASHCVDHQCINCVADGDCSGNTPRCDAVTRACVQCQANADCLTGTPLCDPATSRCVSAP
jgi:Cys-rich repeat protein